jgi:hypothetical protein
MTPLTAKVKCPHYGRQSEFEAEAVEKVASSPYGIGGASLIREKPVIRCRSIIAIPSALRGWLAGMDQGAYPWQ